VNIRPTVKNDSFGLQNHQQELKSFGRSENPSSRAFSKQFLASGPLILTFRLSVALDRRSRDRNFNEENVGPVACARATCSSMLPTPVAQRAHVHCFEQVDVKF